MKPSGNIVLHGKTIPATCYVYVADATLPGSSDRSYVVHWESASDNLEYVRGYAREWDEGDGFIAQIDAKLTPCEQLEWNRIADAEALPLFATPASP